MYRSTRSWITERTEVRQQNLFITARTETKRQRETSQGWEHVKGVKESYPLQLAEYTVQNPVSDEPILRGAFHLCCANVAESSVILFTNIGYKLASSVSRYRGA
jgi:hypothetical protein